MTPALPTISPQSLHILVVDDTATNRQVLSIFLKRMGHRVDLAEDGQKAVQRFGEAAYDLVIMDVMMPVMDGHEATRRIKAMMDDRWVPVVFLSALDGDKNLAAALDAGGDDYLHKPVNFVVLEAKLRSLSRTIFLHRELEETRRVLQVYHDEREAENALAAEVFEQLMKRTGLTDPCLRYWMNPVSHFSGDIVAAARAGDGRFFAVLADATGHGLGAAISILPVLTLFYDIVEQGLPLGRMIERINRQMRKATPAWRFTCAAFLCIDPATGESEIWSGGLPEALVIDREGRVLSNVKSLHLPLGITDFDPQECVTEALPSGPGRQIVMFSDGLIEARNAAGEEFGQARLAAVLSGTPRDERAAAVRQAVLEHVGDKAPHDDVTILFVDLPCPDEAISGRP